MIKPSITICPASVPVRPKPMVKVLMCWVVNGSLLVGRTMLAHTSMAVPELLDVQLLKPLVRRSLA